MDGSTTWQDVPHGHGPAAHAGGIGPARGGAARLVLVVVFDRFQLLDALGPAHVFAVSNDHLAPARNYEVRIASPGGGPVGSRTGVQVHTEPLPAAAALGEDATLIVSGGGGVEAMARDACFLAWLRQACPRVARVCMMGSSARLLGQDQCAGALPAGRPREPAFPAHASDIYACAGDLAALELCLEFIRDDHGSAAAAGLARRLHMAAPAIPAPLPAAPRSQFDALERRIRSSPDKVWSVEEMAGLVNMTTRSFHRRFVAEYAVTPSQFVASTRLEAARQLIAQGNLPLKVVARRAGYGSEANMRNAFHKFFGVTPTQYMETRRGPGRRHPPALRPAMAL